MKKEEYEELADERWRKWQKKTEHYGDELWRKYSINLTLTLAEHRLLEVVRVFRETGYLDRDNLIDAMNFCDMVRMKAK